MLKQARVLLFLCVSLHVRFKVCVTSKMFPTGLTGVRFLTAVDFLVGLTSLTANKCFSTHFAGKRLFTSVASHVDYQVKAGCVFFST